jgi:hypothetical protein
MALQSSPGGDGRDDFCEAGRMLSHSFPRSLLGALNEWSSYLVNFMKILDKGYVSWFV